MQQKHETVEENVRRRRGWNEDPAIAPVSIVDNKQGTAVVYLYNLLGQSVATGHAAGVLPRTGGYSFRPWGHDRR